MPPSKYLGSATLTLCACLLSPVRADDALPWMEAGLTERQAAAYLLDRFAYGPRPGDIDRIVEAGLEAWLEGQLSGSVDDTAFEERVAPLDAWGMELDEILRTFPPPGQVLQEAQRAGVIAPDTPPPGQGDDGEDGTDRRQTRRAMMEYFQEKGYRPNRELLGQLMARKVWQAVSSERQLEAVLTDFWFNHFNVSLTDNQSRTFLLAYERDAIAPGVFGTFHDLLVETAAHPAMLTYLDNAQSTANVGVRTTLQVRAGQFGGPRGRRGAMRDQRQRPNRPTGLNENFARELLELHTLGVDGGYTQEDVVAVARAFTGWTVVPYGPRASSTQRRIDMVRAAGADLGFVVRQSFLFRADAHDAEPKTVLGQRLDGGRGIEDGLEVLEILSSHPSTAKHLAHKLAVRFVSDEPPETLVDRLATSYLETGGRLDELIRTLAYSPEFWSADARGSKIKSPFEVAISAVRALDARVTDAADLVDWVSRMGQPLYAYQTPTGYPDRAEAWVNTGSLLTRMNFGLSLATGRVLGVELDLASLNRNREPESPGEALEIYAALLMPERDLAATLEQLGPVVRDPDLGERLAQAAPEPGSEPPVAGRYGQLRPPKRSGMDGDSNPSFRSLDRRRRREALRQLAAATPPTPLANVVGVILGSPEFQRR